MLCTINTDASFHPKYKVGAYAFWSVCNGFRVQNAGYFNDLCKDPDDAEMKCIINAVYKTLKTSSGLKRIIVNTDSMNSIRVFEHEKKGIRRYNLQWAKKHREQLKSIIKSYKTPVEIEFRHVKAHTGKNDARSYVNEWCDTHAKRFLWRRIHELKLVKNGATKRPKKLRQNS